MHTPYRIAFYDSGIGGLPYVRALTDLLPGANVSYLADTAHFPLGTKPREEVERVVVESVGALVRRVEPDVVVVACNTASVIALAPLRSAYPELPFVGTVPAIKPAAERSASGKIVLFATERTVRDPYTRKLVDEYAKECEVMLSARPEWVRFVEERILDASPEEISGMIRGPVSEALERGADVIVLACTHFLHLEDSIRAFAGDRAIVVDSAEGVAKRAVALLASASPTLHDREGGDIEKVVSGNLLYSSSTLVDASDLRRFSELGARYGLSYGGTLS